uniref:Secreted protein n=1 Tax=Mesocestoides corti TaxID=53468 RepID=A0A5K3FDZ0_MESCO
MAMDVPRSIFPDGMESIFLNNLKLLRADFTKLRLPMEPSDLRGTFRSFQKPALAELIGFLLSKLDPERYRHTVRSMLLTYNRAVDNRLKNVFFVWIKELPMELGLSRSFSRVWSCPCPESMCKFFMILSTYVVQKVFGIEINRGHENAMVRIVDEKVRVFLRSLSSIETMSLSLKRLSSQAMPYDGSVSYPNNQVYADCLKYVQCSNPCVDDFLQMLSSFQEERYNTLDNLKTAFSECLSEWCSLRPLYFAILSIVKNPVVIRAKELDFPPPVEHNIDDIGLMSLSHRSLPFHFFV